MVGDEAERVQESERPVDAASTEHERSAVLAFERRGEERRGPRHHGVERGAGTATAAQVLVGWCARLRARAACVARAAATTASSSGCWARASTRSRAPPVLAGPSKATPRPAPTARRAPAPPGRADERDRQVQREGLGPGLVLPSARHEEDVTRAEHGFHDRRARPVEDPPALVPVELQDDHVVRIGMARDGDFLPGCQVGVDVHLLLELEDNLTARSRTPADPVHRTHEDRPALAQRASGHGSLQVRRGPRQLARTDELVVRVRERPGVDQALRGRQAEHVRPALRVPVDEQRSLSDRAASSAVEMPSSSVTIGSGPR